MNIPFHSIWYFQAKTSSTRQCLVPLAEAMQSFFRRAQEKELADISRDGSRWIAQFYNFNR